MIPMRRLALMLLLGMNLLVSNNPLSASPLSDERSSGINLMLLGAAAWTAWDAVAHSSLLASKVAVSTANITPSPAAINEAQSAELKSQWAAKIKGLVKGRKLSELEGLKSTLDHPIDGMSASDQDKVLAYWEKSRDGLRKQLGKSATSR